MFGGLGRRPAGRPAQATAEWAPSVDVLPKNGDLVVRAEMPGITPENVDVSVHNGVLSISGERKVSPIPKTAKQTLSTPYRLFVEVG